MRISRCISKIYALCLIIHILSVFKTSILCLTSGKITQPSMSYISYISCLIIPVLTIKYCLLEKKRKQTWSTVKVPNHKEYNTFIWQNFTVHIFCYLFVFLVGISLSIIIQNLGSTLYHQFYRNRVVDILEFWN